MSKINGCDALLEEGERLVARIEQALNNLKETKRDLGYLTEQDKWQRVIDEGYLCRFRDGEYEAWSIAHLVETNGDMFLDSERVLWKCCEVLREKGIKQPYFQGDDIPDIGRIVVYYRGDILGEFEYDSEDVDWSQVVAYIEV